MIVINQDKIEILIEDLVESNKLPIFKNSTKFANMIIDTYTVPQNITEKIIKAFVLSKEQQTSAVHKLVDRRPDWLDLNEEERNDEILAVLTLETVAYYLNDKKIIRSGSDMYQNYFDKDGNVVVNVFYIKNSKTKEQIESIRAKKEKEKDNGKK